MVICNTVSAWPETVEDGWNMVVRADEEETKITDHQQLHRERIIQAARFFEPNTDQQNIFGDGKATEMICDLLDS